MAPSFVYEPLTNGKTQFRLLDLHPGPGLIRCCLRAVPIETPEPYEALSYCWGPPEPKRTIFVNSRAFLVSANLYTALLYLRYDDRYRPRTIWIDAICINQSDDDEKNVSIPQMRDIYQSCWRTIMWLGEHDWLTKSAFDGVRFLSTKFGDGGHVGKYYDWRRIRRRDGQQGEGLLGAIWDVAGHLHAVAAFNSVFGRDWFSRLWVIQELALSRQAVFVCGKYQVDWEDISRAQAISSNFIDDASHILRLYQDSPSNGVHNLLDCMFASWTRIASEPKDKVYGLLALASNGDQATPVEKMPTCSRFTTTYIEHSGDLRILAICRGCKRIQTTTVDDPSWVIDYQDYYSGTPEVISWRPGQWEWSAGGTNRRGKPIINGNLFGAQGYEFDSVFKVSSISKTGRKSVKPSYLTGVISSFVSAAGFSRLYIDAQKLASEANPESMYRHGGNTGLTTLEAVWQTLATHHGATVLWGPNEIARDKKIREGVDRLLTRHAGLITIDNLAGFLFSIALYLVVLIMNALGDVSYTEFFAWTPWAKQRRFFVTEKGYFGLGPGETKVGDKVVLLQGGPVPIITRPGERPRIVGESYVLGVMDGQLFDKEQCQLLWFS
ncbi:heterokaryon incompatibility protein-domain-containing protein [Hypoxylon argillaceum]|nr:heterokaryon incompatibility protein-domain-containing protein [Hypoxylon argillaceum]